MLLLPYLSLLLFLIYFPVYDGQLYKDRKTAGGFCLQGWAMAACWPFLVHSFSLALPRDTHLAMTLFSDFNAEAPPAPFLLELPPNFCDCLGDLSSTLHPFQSWLPHSYDVLSWKDSAYP